MKFDKTASTNEEQIALLKDRGMIIQDESHAKRCLETIGYYRLSAYWLPFELPPVGTKTRSKKFKADTLFSTIHELYIFDRKLRLLLLEAIERIEINVRSRWTYRMSHEYGPHAHLLHELFSNGLNHAEQLVRLARSVDNSEEVFVKHFKRKYTEPYSPPLWAATELMTLGELSKWFKATKNNRIKSVVGRDLGLPTKEVTEGVLQNLSYVRNICAHHGRLWNRRLVKRVPLIRNYQEDIVTEEIRGKIQPSNSVFNVIVVILHILQKQNTDSTFRKRLQELIENISPDNRTAMGFPPNWLDLPAWQL